MAGESTSTRWLRGANRATSRWGSSVLTYFLAISCAVVFTVLAPASPASAFETRQGTHITIGPGEVIDNDLVATGQSVTIAGRVTGDAIVFANSINVTGQIDGDLIAAGQQIAVSGVIGGNVRAAGNNVAVHGEVARNFLGAGNLLSLGNEARVGGSWSGAGNSMDVRGTVERGVNAAGNSVTISGQVGRNVTAAADTIVVGPTANIGGSLTYHSDDEATIAGTVSGEVQRREPARAVTIREQADRAWRGFANLLRGVWLIGTLIVGVLLVRFVPGLASISRQLVTRRPISTFLLGLGVLIGGPIAIVILAVTLVGLPLAFLGGMAYAAGIYLAWILFAVAAGALAVELVQRRPVAVAYEWLVVLGVLGLFVLTRIPILGGILGFVGLCLGLGILAVAVWQALQPAPSVPA